MDMINAYPGPALMVDAGGAVRAASPSVAGLIPGAAQDAWWRDLVTWLADPGDPPDPTHKSTIPTARGPIVIDWLATPLPDNTVALIGRNGSAERALRDALTESRQRFRDLVDLAADFAWEVGPDGTFVYVSPQGALGHAASDLLGHSADRLLEDGEDLTRTPFESRQTVTETPMRLRRADGRIADVLVSARPRLDAQGQWSGARGLTRSVTTAHSGEGSP